jgi:RNA polymerase sigma-70 factor (ECF subfamily)
MATQSYPSSAYSTDAPQPLDENELVERFQKGEKEVFNQLVIKYQGKIYNLVYRYVHNAETARDVSQEVFIKAYQALPNFKRQSAFYSWIYQIAIHQCIDFIRQQNRTQTLSLEELSMGVDNEWVFHDSNPLPPEQVEAKELGELIGKAIRQLPPRQRYVFKLRHEEGLQLKEIATRLERSEGTVKTHLHHAHQRLQTLLLPYLRDEPLEWAVNS